MAFHLALLLIRIGIVGRFGVGVRIHRTRTAQSRRDTELWKYPCIEHEPTRQDGEHEYQFFHCIDLCEMGFRERRTCDSVCGANMEIKLTIAIDSAINTSLAEPPEPSMPSVNPIRIVPGSMTITGTIFPTSIHWNTNNENDPCSPRRRKEPPNQCDVFAQRDAQVRGGAQNLKTSTPRKISINKSPMMSGDDDANNKQQDSDHWQPAARHRRPKPGSHPLAFTKMSIYRQVTICQ